LQAKVKTKQFTLTINDANLEVEIMTHKYSFLTILTSVFLTFILSGCGISSIKPDFEVTFDGEDCLVSGPDELPPGDHTFKFIDKSGFGGELWLVYLKEDKTFQDHLDLQSEPGEWYPKPPWVSYDSRVSGESEESDGMRVDTEIWRLDRIGEHTLLCYVPSPAMLWFAAPLMIVDTPSKE
jgi:hypothetical protein